MYVLPAPLTDYFVQQPDALHAFVDIFRIEFGEIRYAREHDADFVDRLRVQLLQNTHGREFTMRSNRGQVQLGAADDGRSLSIHHLYSMRIIYLT